MCSKQKHKSRSRKTFRDRMRLARYYVGGYTMSVKERRLMGMMGKYRHVK